MSMDIAITVTVKLKVVRELLYIAPLLLCLFIDIPIVRGTVKVMFSLKVED